MIRRPPRSTRTDTLFPYTTLFRSALMRCGDVIGIARHAIADDFSIDRRAAALGMLKFLKHDDAGALAHDETVAALVPRPRAGLRVVVEAGRQRAGSGKTGHAERANGCTGPAGAQPNSNRPHT